MICQNAESNLIDFLEGNLEPSERAAMEEHLSDCSKCRSIYQCEKNTKLLLRAKVKRASVSDRLRQTILNQISELGDAYQENHQVRPIALWKPIMAVAATLLVAVGIFIIIVNQRTSLPQVIREEIDEHLQAITSAQPLDISSSNAAELSNWFKKRLDFHPMVANLEKENANLIGGRYLYLENRNVAYLAYKKNKQLVSLFMVKLEDAAPIKQTVREMIKNSPKDQELSISKFKGQTVVLWLDRNILCTLISNLDEQTLIRLARIARSA